ncbi:adhesion G-protein coupled receptor D1-like [Ptychodera flava]|uniref:adhesion G-protein coupled receptor D1-like n=1 Tax=Ptychodera flava TaxID=63121 RepID=UPI003969C9B9
MALSIAVLPLMLVVCSASIAHAQYGSDKNCWLTTEKGAIWAFLGPVLVIIAGNTVILGKIVRVIVSLKCNTNEEKHAKLRSSARATVVLLPLLGLTWVFGILSINSQTLVFEYAFAILNSLQGFFIFLFYCIGSSEVRKQLIRRRETHLATQSITFSKSSSITKTTVRRHSGQVVLQDIGEQSDATINPDMLSNVSFTDTEIFSTGIVAMPQGE